MIIQPVLQADAATTSLFAATSATSIAPFNPKRPSLTIQVDPGETAKLYVLKGTGTVSTTVYSMILNAGGYYEAPVADVALPFSGIWSAAPSIGANVTIGR